MVAMCGFYPGKASNLINEATHFMGIDEKAIESAEDRYLPNSCPGLLLTSGVSDPRDLVINGAEIAGMLNCNKIDYCLYIYSLNH